MNTAKERNTKVLIGIVALVLLGAIAYAGLTMPDRRSPADKIGDAVSQLDDGGLDDAARELEDRTPAQRLSDEVKDATE